MKPILHGRLSSRDRRGFRLDCGDGLSMRVVALAEDLVRVTVLRGGEARQKRSWSVPAYGAEDTEWAGRARLDDTSWPWSRGDRRIGGGCFFRDARVKAHRDAAGSQDGLGAAQWRDFRARPRDAALFLRPKH